MWEEELVSAFMNFAFQPNKTTHPMVDMESMSFSVQRRVSTMTARLFNSAGVDRDDSDSGRNATFARHRTPHEFSNVNNVDGDDDEDDVSEFSLRVASIPPGEDC